MELFRVFAGIIGFILALIGGAVFFGQLVIGNRPPDWAVFLLIFGGLAWLQIQPHGQAAFEHQQILESREENRREEARAAEEYQRERQARQKLDELRRR
jgi:hypothetical protein